jgi:hypothetical protein
MVSNDWLAKQRRAFDTRHERARPKRARPKKVVKTKKKKIVKEFVHGTVVATIADRVAILLVNGEKLILDEAEQSRISVFDFSSEKAIIRHFSALYDVGHLLEGGVEEREKKVGEFKVLCIAAGYASWKVDQLQRAAISKSHWNTFKPSYEGIKIGGGKRRKKN